VDTENLVFQQSVIGRRGQGQSCAP
jgi:hypothetical protein